MNGKSSKRTKYITKYIFLSIGALIVLVTLVSWFVFPDWHAAPGGFWTLIGVASVGVIGIIKDVVALIKDFKELGRNQKQPLEKQKQRQNAVDSEDVEQSMKKVTGIQKQTVEKSKRVNQRME
jgi:hypothetical protein